ncbi:chromosome transmission fidelity protein 8 homolog [Asterias rubens]|uniref:chromosome transmission fidelity protein 8 homolog n=1 Tax=Asterias rubens TaxID=7604 RepID=UPI0014558E26|nr:chromosome transmission fidelity protein 8 homolog [Asterias rubens]
MVQLVVKVAESEGSIPEWMLLEMQGHLESPGEEQLAGNFIGDLHFNKKGIPIIIIGHHILYGKVANLDKPYIVLIKNSKSTTSDPSVSDSGDLNDSVAMDTDNPKDEDSDGIYYKVSAAIKRKIVFKTRPKPIITYVPKK